MFGSVHSAAATIKMKGRDRPLRGCHDESENAGSAIPRPPRYKLKYGIGHAAATRHRADVGFSVGKKNVEWVASALLFKTACGTKPFVFIIVDNVLNAKWLWLKRR